MSKDCKVKLNVHLCIWQYASKYILCESSRSIFMQLKLNHETKFIVYGEEDVSVHYIYIWIF